ncbi:hypothetical protein AB6A40_000038 [Gnathostoma spinigerum]|uniref:BED-type domain-containing protein n=1 Tax=Gnathostoma spinigerum TaxID=75299 RepID=A0ABD6E5I4_9BILA
MRTSRLQELSSMVLAKSYDGLLSDDAGNSSSFDSQSGSTRHQISTDSSGSTSSTSSRDTGVTLPLNSQLMPPKSVIQDDIRMKLGRFELVKKKGRSEVWNLFGQVLDTTTGVRLPYVACYACKVLYTDTGGGTGNMTRHRCPIGSSYKDSSMSSSTETNADLTSQLSFEAGILGNQMSPETSSNTQNVRDKESPAPQPQAHASLTAQSSFETAQSFSELDRRLFCTAAVKCCALDLLPPSIFQGEGFRSLIETAVSIGRRSRYIDRHSITSLIPDGSTLQQVIESSSLTAMTELKAEIGCIGRAMGISLSTESLVYRGEQLVVISANYVANDWKLKRRVISVESNHNAVSSVQHVVKEFVSGISRLMVVTDQAVQLLDNTLSTICILSSLNNVVHSVISDSSDETHDVGSTILSCQRIAGTLEKLGLERWVENVDETHCGRLDYVVYVYELLKFVRECVQHSSISQYPELMSLIRPVDWLLVDDLRKYLEPFHVMATIFSRRDCANFHKVLPEWFALIHEFSSDGDETGIKSESVWLSKLRRSTEATLKSVTNSTINVEHRIATVLNPRLKHLPVICTDLQRMETYSKIRSMIGVLDARSAMKTEEHLSSETMEGEPPRKRISFLTSLEDRAMIQDELECYLRSQFPAAQTKDVLHFWSSLGQTQFPLLSQLAKFILSIPAACYHLSGRGPATLSVELLSSLLLLRSSYLNTSQGGSSNTNKSVPEN